MKHFSRSPVTFRTTMRDTKYSSQSSLIEGKQNVLSSCIFMFGGNLKIKTFKSSYSEFYVNILRIKHKKQDLC